MILSAYPCDINIARLFTRKICLDGSIALILKKQEASLGRILRDSGVKEVYCLEEASYGRLSSTSAMETLKKIKSLGVEQAYFPINDFCANTALLLYLFTDNISAINATSTDDIRCRLKSGHGSTEASEDGGAAANEAERRIACALVEKKELLEKLFSGDASGERPTTGLVSGMPYDREVLSRYAYAAGAACGKVLEIGCGIGYGAYLMSEVNRSIEVSAIDYDRNSIDAARLMWNTPGRLAYEVSGAGSVPFKDASFDTVVSFEVIEHLEDPHAFLSEVNRVLKPGGRFIGSTPNYMLYMYKVNKTGASAAHDELRSAGIWPWHVQELDEYSVERMLKEAGFVPEGNRYPTYVKGMRMLDAMRPLSFADRLDYLRGHLDWSVSDFAALAVYHPIFSGCSFIFEAVKGGGASTAGNSVPKRHP